MIETPFNPVTGSGLGVSYSSLNQIGQVYAENGLGQADLQCYLNVVSGNFTVFDRPVKVDQLNGPLVLGYVYNSQASTCWQLRHKRFIKLNNNEQTAIIQEADSHLTTYTKDASQVYYAPALKDGIPHLVYENQAQRWRWYDPKSRMTEYYDTQGLLTYRRDAMGRTTHFDYDSQNRLIKITDPRENLYEITYSENTSEIRCFSAQKWLNLQSYEFDNQGRIIKTVVQSYQPDNQGTVKQTALYSINYAYGNKNSLTEIKQSDGTVLKLLSQTTQQGVERVTRLRYGTQQTYDINYQTNYAQITDGMKSVTQIDFDSQQRTTQIIRPTGFKDKAKTSYEYHTNGQLKTVTDPDLSQKTFQYGAPFNLLFEEKAPEGQITQYYYQNDPGSATPTRLISKVDYLANQKLITFYCYDTNYNKQNAIFLRFTISPLGQVTEYRPDELGNIASKRVYVAGTHNIQAKSPNSPVSLEEMQDWIATQPKDQINLTDYLHDEYGHIKQEVIYTAIDATGTGIANATRGIIKSDYNRFGNLLNQEVQQDVTEAAQTTQRFDELQRLVKTVDALNEHTSMAYQDNQVTIAYANGRIEMHQLDQSGLLAVETITANQQQRQTKYQRDTAARPVITTLADGQRQFSFYDQQNRLGYAVSPTGSVSYQRYDEVNRFTATIHYTNAINPNQLFNQQFPDLLPTVATLEQLIVPDTQNDRITYKFSDALGRLCYQVDAALYVTQFFYDTLNRKTGSIEYATALTVTQLTQLQQGQTLSLTYDPLKDRAERYFYDDDNRKIGEQDAAGYVVQYQRDAGGRLSQTIHYANPVTPDFTITDFKQIIPTADPLKDAIIQYFYDARNQLIKTIDAENYVTTISYYANGKPQQKTRFDTNNQQSTQYTYDLLERPSKVISPLQKSQTLQYDNMGKLIRSQVIDANAPNQTTPDYQRNTQTRYDQWSQVVADANVFIGQAIYNIETNNNLSPEQKKADIEKLWNEQCERHQYDASGLKITTTDTLGFISYFYYDADRRLIFSINPERALHEQNYNSFDQIILTRAYETFIPEDKVLTGGIATSDLINYFHQLQNGRDEIAQYQYDQRAHVIKITDANGNITTKSYTAFNQLALENLPIATSTPSLSISYQYEPRGLIIQKTKTANQQNLITQYQYHNLHGKVTLATNANLQTTQYQHDRLGRVKTKINAEQIAEQQLTYDAFDRLTSETNALNEITQHQYQDQTRTQTTIDPITTVKKIVQMSAHNQKVQETDSLNDTQTWQHAPNGQITLYQDADQHQTQMHYNTEGQKTVVMNANQIITTYRYNGAEQLIQEIEDITGLKLTTTYQRDSFGNEISITNARNIITTQQFDHNNQLTEQVEDTQNLNLITKHTRNAKGTIISTIKGDKTKLIQYQEDHIVDGFDRPQSYVIDPLHLKITTTQTLDAMGNVVKQTNGNQFPQYKFYDQLDRLALVIDYVGGAYQRQYNEANQLIAEIRYEQAVDLSKVSTQLTLSQALALITPNTQDSFLHYYYDANGQQRFIVHSLGIVSEQRYDLADRLVTKINYATTIATNVNYTTQSLTALMAQKVSVDDRIEYFILDAMGQQRFIINPSNYIEEKRYDAVGNTIATIHYANVVNNPATIAQLPPDQVLAKINTDETLDRATWRVFDSRNLPQFVVDGEGSVVSFSHDNEGNLTERCEFKQPITVPITDYAALIILLRNLKPNPQLDRITQSEFNGANYKTKDTDALGYSDLYQRDALGNIRVHTDRNQQPWLNSYDGANRLISETTPELIVTSITATPTKTLSLHRVKRQTVELPKNVGLPRHFIAGEVCLDENESFYDSCAQVLNQQLQQRAYDSTQLQKLSLQTTTPLQAIPKLCQILNIKFHIIDGATGGHLFIDQYRKRPVEAKDINYQTDKIIHLVYLNHQYVAVLSQNKVNAAYWPQATLTNDYVHLTAADQTQVIVKKTSYDDDNNPLQITDAFNTTQARALYSQYNANNQLINTEIKSIAVNNPNAPASFTTLPVQTLNLTTQTIYNAKNKKVANQNEQGDWQFFVYDSENRLAYTVNFAGSIVANSRNSFGEITQEIRYATPLSLDIKPYIKTGIPLDVLQKAIVTSTNDRTTTYQRDHRGNVTLHQQGPVFYYLPNGDAPQTGTAFQQIQCRYNAFNERIYQGNPTTPQTWADDFTWYDRKGRKRAECDTIGAVKIYQYNDAFAGYSERWEWAQPPSTMPTISTPLAQLINDHQPSIQDRYHDATYDLRGQKISTTLKNEVVQKITLTPQTNVPVMNDLPAQDLTQTFTYTPTQQLASKTFEDGSRAYYFYNVNGKQIASTEVARASKNQNDQSITLVPLTYYQYNALNQVVGSTKFKQGTAYPVNPAQLPTPIAIDTEDQTELKLIDNRGLVTYQQNAQGYVSGSTYTPMRKLARQFNRLTNHEGVYLDEEQFTYNAVNQTIHQQLLRDNVVTVQSQTLYNTFGETIGEGPGDNTYPLYRHYDLTGQLWLSNHREGVNRLTLRNLQNKATLSATSPTKDLSQYQYTDLTTVLNFTIEDLERLETTWDAVGRFIRKTHPAYMAPAADTVTNIPLNIYASDNYPVLGTVSLSWVQPQETNVAPVFNLWSIDAPNQKQTLTVKSSQGRCGVDVSALTTDVYRYEIDYYLLDPATHTPSNQLIYKTQGVSQFITAQSSQTGRMVLEVVNDCQLNINGNTTEISTLQLWQNNQQIAEINLPHNHLLDLSQYPSGTYMIVPIKADKTALPASLPFTITTFIQPTARQITTQDILLNTLGVFGQLGWDASTVVARQPVQLICQYVDINGNKQSQTATIKWNQYDGSYTDKNGNILRSNIKFDYPVKQIQNITLSIQMPDQTSVMVVNNFAPNTNNNYEFDVILRNDFPLTTVIYLTPYPNYVKLPTVSFLDTRDDRLASWKQLTAIDATKDGIVIDVTGIAAGVYPYKLADKMTSFMIGHNVYVSDPLPPPQPVKVQPSREYAYDHWNNLSHQIDTLNNRTDYTYNQRNQCLTTLEPEVEVLHADGTTEKLRPLTTEGFNTRKVHIGIRDANDHTKAFVVDAAGQEIAEILGEGTIAKQQVFDALGRAVLELDARGKKYPQTFDHGNNLTSMQLPSGRTSHYTYNETGHRSSEANPANEIIYYDYDSASNIMTRFLPMGQPTRMSYDLNHRLLDQANFDGSALHWYRDYFGYQLNNQVGHTDLNSYQYIKIYNFKRQVLQAIIIGGHGQNILMEKSLIEITVDGIKIPTKREGFATQAIANNGQTTFYDYRCGSILQVTNSNTRTTYEWDTEKRLIRTDLYIRDNIEELNQSLKTTYDALGREMVTYETSATVNKYYDGVGNIRRQYGVLYPFNSGPIAQDQWNLYDNANRAIIYGGSFDGNSHQIVGGDQYIYTQGLRTQQMNSSSTEILYYNEDGQLTNSNVLNSYLTVRSYDLAGRQFRYDRTGANAEWRRLEFTSNGWTTLEESENLQSTTTTNYGNFNSDGQPTSQHVDYHKDYLYDDLNLNYLGFDNWQISIINGTRHDKNGNSAYTSATQYYDESGITTGQSGVRDAGQDPNDDSPRSVVLNSTPEGRVMTRRELDVNPGGSATTNCAYSRYFYDVGGNVVGSYRENTDNGGSNYALEAYSVFNKVVVVNAYTEIAGIKTQGQIYHDKDKNGDRIYKHHHNAGWAYHDLLRDFEASIQSQIDNLSVIKPIDVNFPAQNNGSYVVNSGDTLSSIAQSVYGDSGYASLIAFKNGVTDDTIVSGLILTLPSLMPTRFRAGTSLSDVLNNALLTLYPNLKAKPPKKSSDWSTIIEVVVDLVAAVIVVVTGGAATPLAIAMVSIAAGLTVFVVDSAYQALAVSQGWQDHYSLRHAITAGIEAGISAGFSGVGAVAGAAAQTGVQASAQAGTAAATESVSEFMLKCSAIAALDQVTEIATGERKRFDWKEFAISVATSAVMRYVGPTEDQTLGAEGNSMTDEAVSATVNNTTQNFINAGLENTFEHRQFNMRNIMEQSLGSIAGQIATDTIRGRVDVDDFSYRTAAKASANNPTIQAQKRARSNHGDKVLLGKNRSAFLHSNGAKPHDSEARYGSGRGQPATRASLSTDINHLIDTANDNTVGSMGSPTQTSFEKWLTNHFSQPQLVKLNSILNRANLYISDANDVLAPIRQHPLESTFLTLLPESGLIESGVLWLSRLTLFSRGSAASATENLLENRTSDKLELLIEQIQDYLGDNMTVMKPGAGKSDLILTSADGTKKIRFDIIHSHGEEPHVNFEVHQLRNKYPGDERMIQVENYHIYPKNTLEDKNAFDSTQRPKF